MEGSSEREIKEAFAEFKGFADNAKDQLIRDQALEIATLKLAIKTGANALTAMRNDMAREFVSQEKPKKKLDYKHDLCRCGNVKLISSPVCRKCYLKDLAKNGRKKKPKKQKKKKK